MVLKIIRLLNIALIKGAGGGGGGSGLSLYKKRFQGVGGEGQMF